MLVILNCIINVGIENNPKQSKQKYPKECSDEIFYQRTDRDGAGYEVGLKFLVSQFTSDLSLFITEGTFRLLMGNLAAPCCKNSALQRFWVYILHFPCTQVQNLAHGLRGRTAMYLLQTNISSRTLSLRHRRLQELLLSLSVSVPISLSITLEHKGTSLAFLGFLIY